MILDSENKYYTQERNVQIVLSILKAHNIRKVVASPGSTNIAIVGSMQHDPFFEMYSCVDERSAAYMACGLAAESGEPVVLSCTGATASRNYYPALTEAYYRKLPILAITSSQDSRRLGHLKDQITDRSCPPKDVVNCSVCLQNILDSTDEWDVTIKANRAVLELWHRGGGPSHINLETTYCRTFPVKELPPAKVIRRYSFEDQLPDLPKGKVAVVVGSHKKMDKRLTDAIDRFCHAYGTIVFTEHASGYSGEYAINYTLASYQKMAKENSGYDVLIHIGEISGFVWQSGWAKEVWRVSEDGELRDLYQCLSNVFEMSEAYFFEKYAEKQSNPLPSTIERYRKSMEEVSSKFPQLPFSQIWITSILHDEIPSGSVVHLGILAPIRSWNFFDIRKDISCDCNQGGFGIDGNISTLLGASLIDKNKLYFCEIGDLSFFYDMNSLGSRHVGNNVRIMVVNNGLGCEFRLFNQVGNIMGEDTDKYISAGGHYGNKSPYVIKQYVESLGYEYMTASSKEEFLSVYKRFITSEITEKPMVFEVFTNVEDENDALSAMSKIVVQEPSLEEKLKGKIRRIVGDDLIESLKRIF